VPLVFGAPCQHLTLAGLEHGRTIPFADLGHLPHSSGSPHTMGGIATCGLSRYDTRPNADQISAGQCRDTATNMPNKKTRRGSKGGCRRPSGSELQQELNEVVRHRAAISEVLRVIASSPHELQPIFDTIIGSATRLCRANSGVLRLNEQQGLRLVAQILHPKTFFERWSPPMPKQQPFRSRLKQQGNGPRPRLRARHRFSTRPRASVSD
jgi:hypothetical protein